MVKVLIVAVLGAGMVLNITGAVRGGIVLAIVGDVLVLGGILMYWAVKRSAVLPSPNLGPEQVVQPEATGQRIEGEPEVTVVENEEGGSDFNNSLER